MEQQLPLFEFDSGARKVKPKRRPSNYNDVRFLRFHRRNPDVWEQILKHAHFLKSHGHTRYGIAAFFENFRWHRRVPGNPDQTEEFKLNNNYRAYYARMLVALPEFKDFFELRETRSERRRRLRGK